MLIDLTEVLSCDGNSQRYEAGAAQKALEVGAEFFEPDPGNPPVFVLTNKGGKKLLIEGTAAFTAVIPCDRCLEDVCVSIPVGFSIETDMKYSDEERVRELDESGFIAGCQLDTDALLREELLLNRPAKILCRDDCRGLCRKCGSNLNLGDCGCDLKEPDPRMAAIADLFKNNG